MYYKKIACLCVFAARGNTTACGEFNFVADTEAAYIVLDRYTCPTYIAPWEFSCRNSLPWVRLHRIMRTFLVVLVFQNTDGFDFPANALKL